MIKVGCCGFSTRQKNYFSHFKVIEIQQTFYQPPSLRVVERWKNKAPSNFEFTLKAPQFITHPPTSPTYRKAKISPEEEKECGNFLLTSFIKKTWKNLREIASLLGTKIIIFQSPASFLPTLENKERMRIFFSSIEREDLILGWEPRGRWREEEIKEICEEFELLDVVDPFKRPPTTGKITYLRLHGKGGYRYRYTDKDLRKLLQFCQEKKSVYFMFNNVWSFEDSLRFKELLEKEGIDYV